VKIVALKFGIVKQVILYLSYQFKVIKKMNLSKTAYWTLRGTDGRTKQRIAERMGITVNRLYYWIKKRSDNLTKAGYLHILQEELGLSESELLEPFSKDIQTAA